MGWVHSILFTPRISIHQQVPNLGCLPNPFAGPGAYSSFVKAVCNSLQGENSCTFNFIHDWNNTVPEFNSCISCAFVHKANIKVWGSCSQFNVFLTANIKRIFYTLLNHFPFFLRNKSQNSNGEFIKIWGINDFDLNSRIINH